MIVREALREGAAALARTETPFLDASLLLAAALGVDAARLLASGPDEVAEGALERYRRDLGMRSTGLPVAYLLGYKEFWGRRFSVDRRVLVPRPDTETLVEAALKLGDSIVQERVEKGELGAKAQSLSAKGAKEANGKRKEEEAEGENSCSISSKPESSFAPFAFSPSRLCAESPSSLRGLRGESYPRLRVHECCAGSLCVAVSLACDRPEWLVSASDLSAEALEVASANAAALVPHDRNGGAVALSRSDLLASVSGEFDLILANPPYVPSSETDSLLAKGWSEPPLALDGGADGLDLVRRLVAEAASSLAPGGGLLVEADSGQAEAVAELLRASRFTDIAAYRDLAGRSRVTRGRKTWTT
jgi:release factor glutamine methyltransferase